MLKGYDDWYLNNTHPVGQDGSKIDEIYLSPPLCEAILYCSLCAS